MVSIAGALGALVALVNNVVQFLWPAYCSYKALETHGAVEVWLTYWVIVGLLAVIEHWLFFVVSLIPFHEIVKLAFLIWLQHPQTQVWYC